MRREGGAAGREETLLCLSSTLLGWLLPAQKNFVPKNLRHFLPGDAERTTFEESTARKLTVVNQSKNCQQRKTHSRERKYQKQGRPCRKKSQIYGHFQYRWRAEPHSLAFGMYFLISHKLIWMMKMAQKVRIYPSKVIT